MKGFRILILAITIGIFSVGCDSGEDSETQDASGFPIESGILAIAETEGSNQIIKVGGLAGSVPPVSEVEVTNLNTGETQSTTALADGSFDPEFVANTNDQFEIVANGIFIEQGGVTVLENIVDQGIANTGMFPNTLKNFGTLTYVVNSGSNNIQVFDFNNKNSDLIDSIILPPGSNPIDIAFLEDKAFVSNFVNQSVAVVDLNTNECDTLITSVELENITPCGNQIVIENAFEEPFEIVIQNGLVFIANNNFDDNFDPDGPGFVTVIDSESLELVEIITASGGNSALMEEINGDIYLVNAGDVNFEAFPFTCNTSFPPSIDIIDTELLSVTSTISIPLESANNNVCLPQFITVSPDETSAYLGLGLVGALLKIDTNNNSLVRGTNNPIIITDLDGLNLPSDMQILPNGIGLITLFNTDQVIGFDTANDTLNPFPFPFPVPAGIAATNPESQLFDGTQFILFLNPDQDNTDVVISTGISQIISRINLDQIFSQ